jgi:hypothetical protein
MELLGALVAGLLVLGWISRSGTNNRILSLDLRWTTHRNFQNGGVIQVYCLRAKTASFMELLGALSVVAGLLVLGWISRSATINCILTYNGQPIVTSETHCKNHKAVIPSAMINRKLR